MSNFPNEFANFKNPHFSLLNLVKILTEQQLANATYIEKQFNKKVRNEQVIAPYSLHHELCWLEGTSNFFNQSELIEPVSL